MGAKASSRTSGNVPKSLWRGMKMHRDRSIYSRWKRPTTNNLGLLYGSQATSMLAEAESTCQTSGTNGRATHVRFGVWPSAFLKQLLYHCRMPVHCGPRQRHLTVFGVLRFRLSTLLEKQLNRPLLTVPCGPQQRCLATFVSG